MKLKEYINFKNGKKRPSELGDIPIYGGNGIVDYTNVYNAKKDSIIIGRVGAYCGCVYKFDDKCWISDNAILGEVKENVDYLYMYYLLKSLNLNKHHIGAAQPLMTQDILNEIEVKIPNYVEQRKISTILSKLDSKVELNNKINDNLYEILVTLYKEELSNNENTEIKTLDEFCNIFTGKKNANQFDENGSYKFFTCGDKELKINSYIFDGPAVIISGNGSYTGRTSFYNGKFDLYQRTYACTIKDEININYIYGLYIIIKNELSKKINGGTHGSAIPYIVMDDLAKFKVNYNKEIFDKYSEIAKTILMKMQLNNEENIKLSELRDTLLPKLMNGEINLNNIKI